VRRPSRKKQNFSAGGERVGDVVRGQTVCTLIFAQPQLQALEQRVAGDAVERGERLVEQEQARRGSESAGQGHALRLAAGEILRTAGGEIGCADKCEHLFDARARRRGRGCAGRRPRWRRR
jgi:hypothetical protein